MWIKAEMFCLAIFYFNSIAENVNVQHFLSFVNVANSQTLSHRGREIEKEATPLVS